MGDANSTRQGHLISAINAENAYRGSPLPSRVAAIVADYADQPGGSRQLLRNGDFETFTSGVPNYWTIGVGSAGTQVIQGGSPFTGASALMFVGDGTTLTSLVLKAMRERHGDLAAPPSPDDEPLAVRSGVG
jgi:hypothetical protein